MGSDPGRRQGTRSVVRRLREPALLLLRRGRRRRWGRVAPRFCGHAGRVASVGFMAPKLPTPDPPIAAAAKDPAASELDEKLAAASSAANRTGGAKQAPSSPPDDDDDEDDDELELEDD